MTPPKCPPFASRVVVEEEKTCNYLWFSIRPGVVWRDFDRHAMLAASVGIAGLVRF